MYEQHVRSSNKSKRWIIVLKKAMAQEQHRIMHANVKSIHSPPPPWPHSPTHSLTESTLGSFEFFV